MFQMILSNMQDPDEHTFFVQVFNDYYLLMFHEATIYISDPHAREDVVQNALVKAIENSTKIYNMDRCKIPTYLVIITRNEAINYLRHENVILKHSAGSIDEIGRDIPSEPALDDLIASLDRKHFLSNAWPQLTKTERILLSGRYFIGYTDRDLADILGCKEDSIRMMLTRARRHAAQVLKEGGVVYE